MSRRAGLPRVLIDASPLRSPSGTRGIGRYVFDLLVGLSETRDAWKDRLTIVALNVLDAPSVVCSEDLVAVAEGGMAAKDTRNIDQLKWQRRTRFHGLFRKSRADLLHLTEPIGTPFPLPFRIPSVVTLYDLIPLVFPTQYSLTLLGAQRFRIAARRRYGGARRVVAISNRSRSDAIKLLGLEPSSIGVAPTGVDLELWSRPTDPADDAARRTRLGVGARPYVLYVGHGDYRKNVAVMLQTVARARALGIHDLELVWAGDVSSLRWVVDEHIRKAGLEGHVRLLGYIADADLVALFRGAIAEVFLSRLEGFGLPVVEGMAAGCPVIVARNSGCDEVTGDAGAVVDADDWEEAAAAIVALASNPELSGARRAAGRARASTFGRASMANGYVEAYQRALERG